jgi:integrase
LKHIKRYVDRHGKRRVYYCRDGKQVPLPDLPENDPEFIAAYAAAQAVPVQRGKDPRGSLAWLIAEYLSSPDYRRLAPATRQNQRRILDKLRERAGHAPFVGIEPKHIRLDCRKLADTPHAARNLLKSWRAVMRFALAANLIEADPARSVAPIKAARTTGFHSWTEGEIAAFEARWPVGTPPRTAFDLLLYTGQRRGDVCRLGWQNYSDGKITLQQAKTGTSLTLPVHAKLAATLATIPRSQMQWTVTASGKTRSVNAFGEWFRSKCLAAGLTGCSAHGLRKAAARRLIESGATPHQAAALTGHRSIRELDVYTRGADQERLAIEAMRMMK